MIATTRMLTALDVLNMAAWFVIGALVRLLAEVRRR
jgi:hypothetical protein